MLGEYGRSTVNEESLLCRDDLDPLVLAVSSPPKYLPSSLAFLLSFLLLLEKKDLPPDDCLDLLSPDDMMLQFRRFDSLCEDGIFPDAPGLKRRTVIFIGVSSYDIDIIWDSQKPPPSRFVKSRFDLQ